MLMSAAGSEHSATTDRAVLERQISTLPFVVIECKPH